jgi:CRISPR/Cas system CSM-associated protein Csm3 (group 7 of RAMP superfamily)
MWMMPSIDLNIELLSDTLVGSGEGWGATIDSDIVFDEYGLPYIPAKRIKGCLRESAVEVLEMFEQAKIKFVSQTEIDSLFGKAGQAESGELSLSNAYIENYASNKQWIEWLENRPGSIFSKDTVLNTFTSIRRQTAIKKSGVKKEHSLRISRVLNRGLKFSAKIEASENTEKKQIEFLSFAARNLRHIGTNRNRGFGLVTCSLSGEQIPDYWESLGNLQKLVEV